MKKILKVFVEKLLTYVLYLVILINVADEQRTFKKNNFKKVIDSDFG